jgi:hypothetical protein
MSGPKDKFSTMRKGHVDTVSHVLIAGWAADTDRPDAVLEVDILVDNQHVVRVTADERRGDLAAMEEFGDGRHGFRVTFAQPLSIDIAHRVSARYANDGTLLPGGERELRAQRAVTAGAKTTMTPILVTGPGRSGTTLLMALLAHAPEIIVSELVPYETRLLSYYANAHNVLTHAADMVNSTHSDDLESDGFGIGFNPFNSPDRAAAFSTPAIARDYEEQYVPERLSEGFRDVIAEYYLRLAGDRRKPSARFFAEKNNNLQYLVRSFTRRAFPGAREIITIRDPRDVMCSQMSYFKMDAERSFAELSHATEITLEIHAEKSPDVCFHRYEDLLRGEKDSFLRLSKFLQTAIEPLTDESIQDIFVSHGTSANAHATLERWRSDLNQEWQKRCLQAWRPFLEAFGYPIK